MRLQFWWDTNARVFDRKHDAAIFSRHVHMHKTLVGEFDRIAQQVDQDLHQTVAVCSHPLRHIRFNCALKIELRTFQAL